MALPAPTESYERTPFTLTREEVRQANAAYKLQRDALGAVRVQVAFFRCPWPCTRAQYERVRKEQVDRWLHYMEQTGWLLVSKVKVALGKRRPAHDLVGDFYALPLLDQVEIPVAAAFKKLDIKLVRTEVPVSDDVEG